MIAKILALLKNRPYSRKEELIVEALCRETRMEQNDKISDEEEECVRGIMRAITVNRTNTSTKQSTVATYLLPVFGSLAAVVLILFGFISLSEKDKQTSPIPEQANVVEPPKLETYTTHYSRETLNKKSLDTLRKAALALPLATEKTRLKRDVRRATDSLLSIALPWGALIDGTPTLTVPSFPTLPQTPYHTEFNNLRQDALNALDFLSDSLFEFQG